MGKPKPDDDDDTKSCGLRNRWGDQKLIPDLFFTQVTEIEPQWESLNTKIKLK